SVRVRLLLDGARLLAEAGAIDQPYANMEIAESLLKDQAGVELAQSAADLAVAYVRVGDNTKARTMFNRALGAAGALNATPDRIIAFTRIAMRYYDARNTTLANEILAEAQVLAATRLVSRDRSRVFAQIAIAQAYLGDIPGALQSAGNAATGEAYQQVLVGVVTALIEAGRTFEAQAIIEKIEADKAYHQLVLRLATYLFYEGDTQRATGLLTSNIPRISLISKLEEQTIFLSQYARVLARLSDRARSVSLFDEAFDLTLKMTDRSQSVNQGMIALDQAKALYVTRAKNTANEIAEPFVRDPVLSQIADIERTLMTVFPESILSKAE
ncbi:MAG: hypothetical protein KDI36_19315, partial [Pseudomonadales bacterium]|nr:hypothetical protein [Pseudomonadales bacterium]